MPAINLIAFDLDGTLVDSEAKNIPDMIAFLAEEYDVHLTLDTWYATGYHGLAGSALLSKLHADFGIKPDPAEFVAKRNTRLVPLYEAYGMPGAPGVESMLQGLVAQKRALCVASNSLPTRIRMSFQYSQPNLRPYIAEEHFFSGLTEDVKPKPAPDVYLKAAQAFSASPATCIAVEDSAVGVTAGLAAGFITVGYLGLARNPTHEEAEMRALGVTHIMHHWDEFLPLLAHLEK